ncbi:unnamed protein product [Orchesella dallaii]|uniref:UDP-N-acetylglucosamine transferase subunit ALG14 n=1 Tax=Orchesella dallaii TaxID=48710 RepID=A0ABP1PR98_9HEXA
MEALVGFVDSLAQAGWLMGKALLTLILGGYFVIGCGMVSYCVLLFLAACLKKIVSSLRGNWLTVDDLPTMIILGSGGHTKEMLKIIPSLSALYPRVYVGANTDPLSLDKAMKFENSSNRRQVELGNVKFLMTYRIRAVGQRLLSVVMCSGPYAFLHAAILVLSERPETIICNGPGTCVPFCVVGYLLTKIRILETRIVFVESVCRVESLSMTGRIMLRFANVYFVQWQELQRKCLELYPHAKVRYMGRLA